MKCVFIANIKSPQVFFVQAPSDVITAGHFPPGLTHGFCLHWITCIGKAANCIFDRVGVLKVLRESQVCEGNLANNNTAHFAWLLVLWL